MKVKPRTLSGFMELLPEDQMKMERMMQILRDTYSLFAFYPLIPRLSKPLMFSWPRAGERRRSRSTVSRKGTATCRCASI